jgi:murein lipoprotein
MLRKTGILLPLAALWLLVGCATSGDLESLSDRVSRLESQSETNANRIGALEAKYSDVAATAEDSARRAADAEARAREAEGRADDAARKADAIFNKSVSK